MLSESPHTIDHGPSKVSLWLQQRRVRIAFWVAAAESIVVLFSHDITRWTVIAIAAVSVFTWIAGRESRSHLVRQVLWIFAASQLLAVIGVILAWIVKWALITAVVLFAIVGLVYLFLDRR